LTGRAWHYLVKLEIVFQNLTLHHDQGSVIVVVQVDFLTGVLGEDQVGDQGEDQVEDKMDAQVLVYMVVLVEVAYKLQGAFPIQGLQNPGNKLVSFIFNRSNERNVLGGLQNLASFQGESLASFQGESLAELNMLLPVSQEVKHVIIDLDMFHSW
jgi:hypothetical protein